MTKKLVVFIIILLLISSFSCYAISDNLNNSSTNENIDQIIIKFKDNKNILSNLNMFNFENIHDKEIVDLGNNTMVLSVDSQYKDKIIKELSMDASIEYVEENHIYTLHDKPNDTYYYNLWHLDNIKAESAWNQIKMVSKEVVVAVIDSGIDYSHMDLVNRIAPGGYNFIVNGESFYDYDGHGTFISGIISAESNNNYGVTGLSGNANIKILPLKVTNQLGEASSINIIKAIDYSISNKVDVINLSLGGPEYSNSFKEAIDRAINANIVVVSSIGNSAMDGNAVNYPASYNGVISVGSTNKVNKRSQFSNFNTYLDIVAPGEYIFSTAINNRFDFGSGTSYATPMVSATAALLKSIDPNLSVNEVTDIITTTAVDLGTKGRDNYYGFGLLDMSAAVKKVVKTPIAPLIPVIDEYTDYKFMNVLEDKVFRIQFNYNLLNSSLTDNIYTSTMKDGSIKNNNFNISIDKQDNKIVLIEPKIKWAKGYNYFFINDNVIGIAGQKHKSKLRITYYVN